MKWYRDSYAAYHPELDRYVCHCMSNGKPGCTFLDPETGTYVKDAAAWKAKPGTAGREFGCLPAGEYNGCYDFGVETPKPAMPFSMMAGDSPTVTVVHRLSNRPEALCTNRGCCWSESWPA